MTKPYSVKTLAERWECSEDTVRALITAGRLPAFRVGGKLLRISAEAVERWESAGENTRLADTGSGSSKARPSSRGATKPASTAEDWASLEVK